MERCLSFSSESVTKQKKLKTTKKLKKKIKNRKK